MTTKEGPGLTVLDVLREVAGRWDLRMLDEDIEHLVSDRSVQVGFLGDFSSGKSTLINELTGVDDLMPTQLEPCTARAGEVVSTPDLDAPEYFRVAPDGETTPISRPDFDDLARGRTAGRPRVRLPSGPGFPAGFVFLDTPGLSTLIEHHTAVTFGELPNVDAAVICVDIRKGGLTSTVTTFLESPGVRHLQHRFLIALTFADHLLPSERQEVAEKVAGTLSRTIGCSHSEAAGRIVVVSSGPDAAERDVSALRTAIQEVFESRMESLTAERQARAADRLIPRAITLLDHVRSGLLESDDDFTRRKTQEDEKRPRLDDELRRERQRLERSQAELRHEVQSTCSRFRARFAAAADDRAVEEVSGAFTTALSDAVRDHLARFGQNATPHVEGIDLEIQQAVKNTNKITGWAATAATAALTAVIVPGVGAAASAAEVAGGAALRQGAARAAVTAAVVQAASDTETDRGRGQGDRPLSRVLKAVHDFNPINMVSDLVGEWWKGRRIEQPLEQVAIDFSARAGHMIETYFESEVFQPKERERDETRATIDQLDADRRTDLADRTTKVSRVDTDVERLQALVATNESPAPTPSHDQSARESTETA